MQYVDKVAIGGDYIISLHDKWRNFIKSKYQTEMLMKEEVKSERDINPKTLLLWLKKLAAAGFE